MKCKEEEDFDEIDSQTLGRAECLEMYVGREVARLPHVASRLRISYSRRPSYAICVAIAFDAFENRCIRNTFLLCAAANFPLRGIG